MVPKVKKEVPAFLKAKAKAKAKALKAKEAVLKGVHSQEKKKKKKKIGMFPNFQWGKDAVALKAAPIS